MIGSPFKLRTSHTIALYYRAIKLPSLEVNGILSAMSERIVGDHIGIMMAREQKRAYVLSFTANYYARTPEMTREQYYDRVEALIPDLFVAAPLTRVDRALKRNPHRTPHMWVDFAAIEAGAVLFMSDSIGVSRFEEIIHLHSTEATGEAIFHRAIAGLIDRGAPEEMVNALIEQHIYTTSLKPRTRKS